MVFKCCESRSGFLLLANCSTNVFVNWAKEQIELFGRLVYHCKAGLIKFEPNPLHMQASLRSLGMVVVDIRCLYYAMWSSGSVVPSYRFIFGKLNFWGISTKAMLSMNRESTYKLTELFLIGAGIPEILLIRYSILLSQQCSSSSCVLDWSETSIAFDGAMSLETRAVFIGKITSFSWFWLAWLSIGACLTSFVWSLVIISIKISSKGIDLTSMQNLKLLGVCSLARTSIWCWYWRFCIWISSFSCSNWQSHSFT